ncbi:MAG: Uma2 family endonuclease [Verrucomicrobia bacterium]|nr:Uma2 family endonuclease [Verrucomicrobiota bacterium]
MSVPTLRRTFPEQHAVNRQVWERLIDDPSLNDVLEKIETDRDGNLIMSPPPRTPHRIRQHHINQLLERQLPEGGSFTEGAVSTPEGVKVADAVWYRAENARTLETADVSLPEFAPDICVEVRSKRNSKRDIQKKTDAYFGAGVQEVWVSDLDGTMTFYSREGLLEHSAICPAFPRHIPTTFLR